MDQNKPSISLLIFNGFTLFLCFAWNLFMVVGTIYLIDEYHWSAWTLVVTLFFFASWKPYKMVKDEVEQEKKEEQSRIVLDEKLPS
jgi:hypothetical protein